MSIKTQFANKIIQLFWYVPWQFIRDNIEKDRLPLSKLGSSNDPSEMMPQSVQSGDDSVDAYRWAIDLKESPPLMLCLSTRMSSLAMWGHYGKVHTGACFVFEFELNEAETLQADGTNVILYPAIYEETRCIVPDTNSQSSQFEIDLMRFICAKGKDWSYEQEMRILVMMDLDNAFHHSRISYDETLDMFFFSSIMKNHLRGIILGQDSPVRCYQIEHLLRKNKYEDVKVEKAKLSEDKFKVESKSFQDMDESEYREILKHAEHRYFKVDL